MRRFSLQKLLPVSGIVNSQHFQKSSFNGTYFSVIGTELATLPDGFSNHSKQNQFSLGILDIVGLSVEGLVFVEVGFEAFVSLSALQDPLQV